MYNSSRFRPAMSTVTTSSVKTAAASSSGEETVCDFRDEFDRQVRALDAKVNSFCIADGEHYARIVREVIEAKNRARKRPLDYRRLKRYDVTAADADDARTLVLPPPDNGKRTTTTTTTTDDGTRRRYVHNGQLFDVLRTSHLDTGHGGLHKMHVDLKRRYANVTRPVIQIFLANCGTCKRRRRGRRRRDGDGGGGQMDAETVTRPHRPLIERALVDVVDASGCAGFVLVYQDSRTKFVVLRALGSRAAREVCDHLTQVFCLFGAPAVLRFCSGGDRAFRDRVTDELVTSTWPRLQIVWAEAADGWSTAAAAEAVLKSRPSDDGSLAFCQYRYNNASHPDVGRSPFQALFGGRGNDSAQEPRVTTPPDGRDRSVIARAPAAPVPTTAAAARSDGEGQRPACCDDEDDDAKRSARKLCRPPPTKRARPPDAAVSVERL